jgi:hypothetical protein
MSRFGHAPAFAACRNNSSEGNHGRLPVLTYSSPCVACCLATEVFAPGPGEFVPHQDGYETNTVRNNATNVVRNKQPETVGWPRPRASTSQRAAMQIAYSRYWILIRPMRQRAWRRSVPVRIETRVSIERWGFQRQAPGRFSLTSSVVKMRKMLNEDVIEPSECGLPFAFCDLVRTGFAFGPTQRTGSTFQPCPAISSCSLDRVKISPYSHTQRRVV